MQSSTRRVLFNPTSIPSLRTKKPQSRDFYNDSTLLRVGLKNGVESARWRGLRGSVRRESTQIGEDRTGHIKAQANEGILFFDSMLESTSFVQTCFYMSCWKKKC